VCKSAHGYLLVDADLDHNIPDSTEEDLWGMEKYGVLHFDNKRPIVRMC